MNTTNTMMKPTIMVVHMTTWSGTVQASLGFFDLATMTVAARAAGVPTSPPCLATGSRRSCGERSEARHQGAALAQSQRGNRRKSRARGLMVCGGMSHAEMAAQIAQQASRGPRYTSYPPATEMRGLHAAAVEHELAEVGAAGEPISLYVHVPFCRSLCWYCGCNVIPTRDTERGVAYVEDIGAELARLAQSLGRRMPVAELALGGGSPNFLSPPALERLFALIAQHFELAPDARRSIELDPRTTTSAQLDTLAAAGFRSMSMGVQDFSEAVQDAIHRHQTPLQTRWLVDRARAVGFDDINIDVVYGLPLQTPESFTRTLQAVIDLAPDRIALFGYAHLPERIPHQRLVERAGRILDSHERANLLLDAIAQLTGAGYLHLGLDHFAKPGSPLARAAAQHRMVRSFQGYAEHRADAILGVGVSSISSTPNLFWQNHAELAPWQAALGEQALPIARGVVLDADDQLRRDVISALMCYGEADLRAIGDAHGIAAASYFAPELAELDVHGSLRQLATYDRQRQVIATTPAGRLLVRNVCMVFDRYHQRALAAAAAHASSAPPRFSPTI